MPTDLPMTFLRQDMAEALAQDRLDDEEAERLERADIARRAAEQEHAAVTAAEEAAAEFAQAEPPPRPSGSGADDLSPMRRRLLDYVAWVADLEAQHAALIAGRTAYLTAQKVPTLTKAAIDQLIKEDKSGLVSLMTEGGKAVSQHALRSRERAMLAEKLRHDQHQAETATAALVEVEAKIDALEQQIAVVQSRHKSFIADALAEVVAASAGVKLIAKMDALHDGALTVMGAHGALQHLRGFSHQPRRHEVALPTPRLPTDMWHSATQDMPGHYTESGSGYTIAFEIHQQEAEQRRWMAKAEALLADPRADIGET